MVVAQVKFTPQVYSIVDSPMQSFIDEDEIWNYILSARPSDNDINNIISKSLDKQRLCLEDVAMLIAANSPQQIENIKQAARSLKQQVYGNRIVLFAPLYVGNKCENNCTYCGFRASNTSAKRTSLSDEQLIAEIEALEDNGQKRLILVFGEHPQYDAKFIANSIKIAYGVKKGKGEIRRINVNAAPFDIDGFRTVKDAGIGTFQVFQETYHREAYKQFHQKGKKTDYDYRLTALDRAQEAGLDDVGIGALFGLYDWRFEVMALVRHVNHLEACYNIGPHTISFPRLKDASNLQLTDKYLVSDEDFTRLIAILRLAVPYTGMILTARESPLLRNQILQFGVSQIDGGTRIEMGAYSKQPSHNQDLDNEQFKIGDDRSLNDIIDELLAQKMLPSFCTSCYRMGRTGEHFMEFSVPGFIKRFCTPNAILTLAEYLCDYAPKHTQQAGWALIDEEIAALDDSKTKRALLNKLNLIRNGSRDLYF